MGSPSTKKSTYVTTNSALLSDPTPEGRELLVQGVLNDITWLYWRSSIGLPMQQLKPGGGGGGWTCTAKRKSVLCACARCASNASRLLQTSMICEWFEAS